MAFNCPAGTARHLIELGVLLLTDAKRIAIAAVTLALVVFAGWQLAGWGGPEATRVGAAVGAAFASALAFGGATRAASKARGRQRAAWICLACGVSGWLVADVYRMCVTLSDTGRELAPWSTVMEHLVLALGVGVGAVIVPIGRGRSGLRVLLDGVVVATALYLVAWVLVIDDLAADASTDLRFAFYIAIVIADMAMIAISAMGLVRARPGLRLSPGLLMAAMIALGLTDAQVLYRYLRGVDTGTLHLGWTTAMCLVGLAGLVSRRQPAPSTRPAPRPSRLSLWLPYLPVPLAVSLGAMQLWTGDGANGYLLIPGLILIFSALARQMTLLAENHRLLETVAGLAMRDPLTGLANRALFSDRLAEAVNVRQASGTQVAVLLIDIDDFKFVNDSLGHSAGDAMLTAVGGRIRASTGVKDVVARIGGDEFAVLIEDTPEAAALAAEQIVGAFDEPVVVDDRPLYMRISVGMATASAPEDGDVSADELLRRADLAMYSAKRRHTGGVQDFTPTMSHDPAQFHLPQRKQSAERNSLSSRMQLLAELRRAIDERRLEFAYQPKVSLSTGEIVGVEALLRWPHRTLGMLEPDDFLPLIREYGLLEHLTNMVLPMAIRDAAGWYGSGLNIPVAVNLSTPSLSDESLPDRVESLLAEHNLPAEALTIEITEDVLLASVVRARSALDRLQEQGVRIAIDDFGSGFATMSYLRDLPVDELKLDRQFVTPILSDIRSATIVRSIVALADAFGIASVAEGVEDAGTAQRLREYGCGYAQGHYFSPPVPTAAIRLGIWGSKLTDIRTVPSAP